MTIRKIIAPLTGGERDRVVLASAFAAAKPFAAHVVALFVRPDPAEAMPFFGEGVSATVVQEIVDVAKEAADRAAVSARASLAAVAGADGVSCCWIPRSTRTATSASFRDVQGNFSPIASLQAARLSDLVVLGPLSDRRQAGPDGSVRIHAGRDGPSRPADGHRALARDFDGKIALAWDGSLSCAHAAIAALPYLSLAQPRSRFCRCGAMRPRKTLCRRFMNIWRCTSIRLRRPCDGRAHAA
jgi:hypothetical protein